MYIQCDIIRFRVWLVFSSWQNKGQVKNICDIHVSCDGNFKPKLIEDDTQVFFTFSIIPEKALICHFCPAENYCRVLQ